MTAISNSSSQERNQPLEESKYKHLGRTTDEQLLKNQAALDLIRSWQEEKLSEDELRQVQEAWDKVKQIIDENRSYPLFSKTSY